MKFLGQISILLFATLFVVSATGVVVFKSNCSCLNDEQVSLYLSPETCHDTHLQVSEDKVCTSNCCSSNTIQEDVDVNLMSCHGEGDCGCTSPETFYFILEDQAENEIRFLVPEIPVMKITTIHLNLVVSHPIDVESDVNEVFDSPPVLSTGQDYLIEIQCLKIPSHT